MTGNRLAVSIIVPCYNAENFIGRGISSIIHQTCPDWELILIDDGSTDSTAVICQRAATEDKRVHFVEQKNQGVSAARNAGLDMAKGQYVMFMDSDDYMSPDILAFTLREADKYDADIVMVGHNRVEKDGRIHSDSAHWIDTENSAKIKEDILLNRLPNFVWGKLYKKSLWDNIRMPVGQIMEDLYIMPEVFYKARRVILRKDPYYYYSHENEHSIMSEAGTHYIRRKYDHFLAWENHEGIANQYNNQEASLLCAQKSMRSIVRALSLDAGVCALSDAERNYGLQYIRKSSALLPFHICVLRDMLLSNHRRLLKLFGKIQRVLIERQQRRRARRG